MGQSFSRSERVAGFMQREIAKLIRHQLTDPRLTQVTISYVRVTRDLSVAKIYFSLFDTSQENIDKTLKILIHATGYLRRALAQKMKLRIMPELRFVYDQSIEHGQHMEAIFAALSKEKAVEKKSDLDFE